MYILCLTLGLNVIDFAPVIGLCFMAQLVLKQGEYPGGHGGWGDTRQGTAGRF